MPDTELVARSADVLLVSDRPLSGVKERLHADGAAVITAGMRGALRAAFQARPEVIVLGADPREPAGVEFLRGVRLLADTPVLMVGPAVPEEAVVTALREGADAYMSEPASLEELAARVAVLRRAASRHTTSRYRDGLLEIDFDAVRVTVAGKDLALSPLEYGLLAALVKAPNTVISAKRLHEEVWKGRSGGPGSVKVTLAYLRRRFAARGIPSPIKTVRGHGYRYEPQPVSQRVELALAAYERRFEPLEELRGPRGQKFFPTASAREELARALSTASDWGR